MKFCLLLLLILSFTGCATQRLKQTNKLSIIQGQTTAASVELSIVSFKDHGVMEFILIDGGETLPAPEIKEITHPGKSEKIFKIFFDQLTPKSQHLKLIIKKDGVQVDERMLTPYHEGKNLRLVVVSCMDDSYEELKPIWDSIKKANPEIILMIGDNVYGDLVGSSVKPATPEQLWTRYIETRSSLPIFFEPALTPILAIWDDHDSGTNGPTKDYPHLAKNREIFDQFFAQSVDNDQMDKGPGLSYLFDKGPYRFFFLDGRSFRTPRDGKDHLGQDQLDWFFDRLSFDERPAFVIKGDQFFGGYHQWESYEGNHPTEFADFLERIRKDDSPFFLISGDRHLSEIMQFPRYLMNRVTFEITSSPAHGKTYPGSLEKYKSPWHIVGYDKASNFTVIDSDFIDQFWILNISNYNAEGQMNYRRELSLFVEDLKNNLNQPDKMRKNRWKGRKKIPRAPRSRRGRRR